ncbi:MAG: O-acetyl-ADP-ribose deacetylase [Cytophagales bacterium]|nr:O-acetyl-ADP-ribose deacetylase [Cytophagales bacterium]
MNTLKLVKGDITKLHVDVVVNAANNGLRGGGGVDGAIHRAGGPAIMEACKKIGGCPTGAAVITTGGNLPAKKVIHTVGPIWNGGNNQENTLLENAYKNSLALAVENGLKSIAFPNISTGVYGFPKELAAKIAVETVLEFQKNQESEIEVTFVCFDEENFMIYKQVLGE